MNRESARAPRAFPAVLTRREPMKEQAMREIHVKRIIEEISHLCIEANSYIDESVAVALLQAHGTGISRVGQRVLT